MIRINDIIFSLDLLEKKFRCDLPECHGNCCRYGDSGAPVTEEEAEILEQIWPEVKPYLRPEGIGAIEDDGPSTFDFENDRVTPLINNEECAYAVLNENIYMCGIEKAWMDEKISFRKPLSCHLFPARIKRFSGITAVNYQELTICSAAVDCGKRENIPVYVFLKEPLVRVFGEEVFKDLAAAAEELLKSRKS